MKRFGLIVSITFLGIVGVAMWVADYHPEIVGGYQANARTPLFSGFITLGSFLLTLKTTILQRLKDGFDSKEHEDAYLYNIENGGSGAYYESLANMSVALSWAVFFSLGTSACQMTIGFVNSTWAFGVCAAMPASTLIWITFLWREISIAHRGWIKKIEEDKITTLHKTQGAPAAQGASLVKKGKQVKGKQPS